MKIVQVIPDLTFGGAETMCENLTYALMELGHQVTVISLFSIRSPITDRLEQRGVDIRYLDKKPGLDFSMIWKIRKILKETGADVIHTHRYTTPYAIIPAMMVGIKKRVHTLHSIAQKENKALGKAFNKLLFKRHHVIPVALSETVQNSIVDVYKIPKTKIPIVFNGINLANCLPKEDYQIHNAFKIVHVGRFSAEKNHLGLIAAYKLFYSKHHDSELWLIGDGPEKESIENTVKENGLIESVKFLGLQSKVYGYLHDADVFALTSNYEGMPMTIIEAMGTGLPIVATAVGGIPDMLRNNQDAVIVENNVEQIANAFERYYESKELRQNCGESAKNRSSVFSAEEMARKYLEIYELKDYPPLASR